MDIIPVAKFFGRRNPGRNDFAARRAETGRNRYCGFPSSSQTRREFGALKRFLQFQKQWQGEELLCFSTQCSGDQLSRWALPEGTGNEGIGINDQLHAPAAPSGRP
jgi:hypothetical protein